MRWGRIGREGNAPMAGARFSRQSGFACLAGCLIALTTLAPNAAFAQLTVQQAADLFSPQIAKQFPPNRTTDCPEKCKTQQEALNEAWQELFRYVKDYPELRAVARAANAEVDAQEKFDAATKAGTGVAAAQATLTQAKQKNKQTKEDQKVDGPNYKKLSAPLVGLKQKIVDAAKALEACETACKQAAKPAEKPADGPVDGPVEGGGGGVPEVPECPSQAFIDDLNDKILAISGQLGGVHGLQSDLDNLDKSDPAYAEKEKIVNQAKAKRAALEKARDQAEANRKKNCPKGGAMYFPGTPRDGQTYAVTFVDSGVDCTYGKSEPISTPLTPTDVSYNPLPSDVVPPGGRTPTGDGSTPTDTPKTPGTPATDKPVSDTPKTPTDTPKTPTTAETPPPEQPKTPDRPTTTEKPPEQPPTTTTEATPTDDIVILFKGNQAVLERGQTGEALQGQHVMLVFRKPDLRESGAGQPVKDDSGFDKNGVHAVTGADGQAQVKVPAEDRALYLSSLGDRPNKYYRVDANVMKNTGSVSELARNAKPDLSGGAPQGGKVASETFKIGNRSFVRRLNVAPFGVNVVLLSGQKVDWCRVIEPGPPLGMEPDYPSALHRELPGAIVKLLPQARPTGRRHTQ